MNPSSDVSALSGSTLSVEELGDLDRRYVIHPHAVVGDSTRRPIIVAGAANTEIWDVEGRRYIDGTCGLWQCLVGHGREEIVAAATEQMRQLAFYSSFGSFSNEPSIRLAARLAQLPGMPRGGVFFTSGGSDGNDTAVKLARRAWDLAGFPSRSAVISRRRSYHGVGLGSMVATGIERFKSGFGPLAPGFHHVSEPDPRLDRPVEFYAEELEQTINQIGADNVAAFIGEPVLAMSGVLAPPAGYWESIQEVLDKYGVLLIVDEVVTGFGRIGRWAGGSRFGIEPDFAVVAKGLTSGYAPLGAVLVNERVRDMLAGHPLYHGTTYFGHPVAAAVALANIDIIERENLTAAADTTGDYLRTALEAACSSKVSVRAVRGVGMMIAVEVAAEVDTSDIERNAREQGLLVRSVGENVVLSPSLTISRSSCDRVVAIMDSVLH